MADLSFIDDDSGGDSMSERARFEGNEREVIRRDETDEYVVQWVDS